MVAVGVGGRADCCRRRSCYQHRSRSDGRTAQLHEMQRLAGLFSVWVAGEAIQMITATKRAITARRDDLRVARLVAVIGASGRYQRHTGTHKDRWEQAGGRDDDACRAEAFDSRTPWTGSCSPTSSSLSLKASADRFPCRRGRYVVRAILLTSSGKRGGAFHLDVATPYISEISRFLAVLSRSRACVVEIFSYYDNK